MTPLKLRIKAPTGVIETVIESPDRAAFPTPHGVALIAHPHPLKGGSLDNKVAWSMARAALSCGLIAVRPNFRGVGASEGVFDHGIGETDDMLTLAGAIEIHLARQGLTLPWTLMGFSFGAYVQHRVAARMPARQLIMVGPAMSMYDFAAPACPTCIIHGSEDEIIPLATVRDYAQLHHVPLFEIAEAGHFFHARLKLLQAQVQACCMQPAQ